MKGNTSLMRRWGSIWIKAMALYLALVLMFGVLIHASRKVICSHKAQGVVTEITRDLKRGSEKKYQYRLNVSFTADDGETYNVGQILRNASFYQVDQEVELYYSPNDPRIFYLSE